LKQLILIGGLPWKADPGRNALALAIRSHSKSELNVAFCNFARNHNNPEELDEALRGMFSQFSGRRRLKFQTMTSRDFRASSKWADVIYMPGGDPILLLSEFEKHPDISELWDGKIIAGASAGADVLCARYCYLQDKSFGTGLGWLNVTCVPHWRRYDGYSSEDWDDLRLNAVKHFPDLPVLCIPESEFIEFTVG
jgi:peptidase E